MGTTPVLPSHSPFFDGADYQPLSRPWLGFFNDLLNASGAKTGEGPGSSAAHPEAGLPSVTLGTPVITVLGAETYIHLPVTYPADLETLTNLSARLETPFMGVPGDSATNVPPEGTAVTFGPFAVDPTFAGKTLEIVLGHYSPAVQEQWGIWVTSASPTVQRSYTEDGTPFVLVTVDPIARPEQDHFPPVRNLSVTISRTGLAGADQFWNPTITFDFPEFGYDDVAYWDLLAYFKTAEERGYMTTIASQFGKAPKNYGAPPSPENLAVVIGSVLRGENSVSSSVKIRTPDSPEEVVFWVLGRAEDGRRNAPKLGSSDSISVVIQKEGVIAGAEYAAVVGNFRLDAEPYYAIGDGSGQSGLEMPLAWDKPDDFRWGGAVIIVRRDVDGTMETTPVLHTSPSTVPSKVMVTADESFTAWCLSADANGNVNSYQADDGDDSHAFTPYFSFTVHPKAVTNPVPDLTNFKVVTAYSEDKDGNPIMTILPSHDAPTDPSYGGYDLWCRVLGTSPPFRVNFGWRYLGNELCVLNADSFPLVSQTWRFVANMVDVNLRRKYADGAAAEAAGAVFYDATVEPPGDEAPYVTEVSASLLEPANDGDDADGTDEYGFSGHCTLPAAATYKGAQVWATYAVGEDPLGYRNHLGDLDEKGNFTFGFWNKNGQTIDWVLRFVSYNANKRLTDGGIVTATPKSSVLHMVPRSGALNLPRANPATYNQGEIGIDPETDKFGVVRLLVERLIGGQMRLGGLTSGTWTAAITVTAGNPTTVTKAGHKLATGTYIKWRGGTGSGTWAKLNGMWLVTVVDDDSFTVPLNSTGFGAYTGTSQEYAVMVAGAMEVYTDAGNLAVQCGRIYKGAGATNNPLNYFFGLRLLGTDLTLLFDPTTGLVIQNTAAGGDQVVLSSGDVRVQDVADPTHLWSDFASNQWQGSTRREVSGVWVGGTFEVSLIDGDVRFTLRDEDDAVIFNATTAGTVLGKPLTLDGDIDLINGHVLKVAGIPVVGAQGATINDIGTLNTPLGPNDQLYKNTMNLILNRMKTRGMIASS